MRSGEFPLFRATLLFPEIVLARKNTYPDEPLILKNFFRQKPCQSNPKPLFAVDHGIRLSKVKD